jgi:hypothetical protein
VVETIWPYLDKATADAIVVNVDPILEEYRPPVFSSIKFDKFTFGNIPATVEGVKVYDTGNEGSVEADIFVVWAGNPNVVRCPILLMPGGGGKGCRAEKESRSHGSWLLKLT